MLFEKDGEAHTVHKPHPSNLIKGYAMKQILDFLIEKGYISGNSVNKDND